MRKIVTVMGIAGGLMLSGCISYRGPTSQTTASLAKTWHLVSIKNRPVATKTMTLSLTADGQASGTLGCNSFSGSYALSTDVIEFKKIAITLVGCVGPNQAAVADAEKLFAVPGKVKLRQGVMEITAATSSFTFRH